MLKKILLPALLFLISAKLVASPSQPETLPDEGMWLPLYLKQLNEKTMQSMGLKLTADDIYNINHTSLKDAVVRLGSGFCTAEIVSDQGLLFTNHHCGYDVVAQHSDTAHNYLANGFWAKSFKEELPNKYLTASILVSMEDISARVNTALKPAGDNQDMRNTLFNLVEDSILKEWVKSNKEKNGEGKGYVAEVKRFFEGNDYYLLVYQKFRDVRLVAAPPQGIGKFGGETDNWMWPRHTGDFSILRIYTGPDGNPADYDSLKNIPYKPKTFFKISLKGVKPGDFTMIMGYPGSTERYLTSYDLELTRDYDNPAAIHVYGKQLEILKQAMDADPVTKLERASAYASISNTYKYMVGQQRLLKDEVFERKRLEQDSFQQWADADSARQKKYGTLLGQIRDANERAKHIETPLEYFLQGIFNTGLFQYSFGYSSVYYEERGHHQLFGDKKDKTFEKHLDSLVPTFIPAAVQYLNKPKTVELNKKVFTEMLILNFQEVPDPQRPPLLNEIFEKYKDGLAEDRIRLYMDDLYKNSALLNQEKAIKLLSKGSAKKLEKDPLYHLMSSMLDYYFNGPAASRSSSATELVKLRRYYLQGLREWKPGHAAYPDANSTLRLSYGKVEAYSPRDAVKYKYYTTYEGILEKANPNDPEFNAPQKELDLFRAKKFGRYAQNDTLRLNFLTNNDITGGNSGSPVLNASGSLIGLAFDGDWESMISDIYVDPKYSRAICVDIRYVLWVIEYYGEAKNIMSELRYEE